MFIGIGCDQEYQKKINLKMQIETLLPLRM